MLPATQAVVMSRENQEMVAAAVADTVAGRNCGMGAAAAGSDVTPELVAQLQTLGFARALAQRALQVRFVGRSCRRVA